MGRGVDKLGPLPKSAWIVLLTVALLIRLGWGLSRPVDSTWINTLPDQREYLELGRNLLSRGSLQFVDPRFEQTVYSFRMPGYPLLIAACDGNLRCIRVVQAVLDTGTVAAAALLAKAVFGAESTAFAAALLVALNPFLIYFSGLILSDTLYAAMFAWALLLLQRRQLMWGSLLLALGVLARPSGLLLAFVLPGVAAAMLNRTVGSAVRTTLIVFALVVMTLLPWAYRNHHRLDAWVFTTTNTGFTLYDGFHDGATGESDQRFVSKLPELQTAGEVGRSHLLTDRASAWIRANPFACVRLAYLKLLRFWSPVPLSAEFSRPAYVIAAAMYSPIEVIALIVVWKRRYDLRSLALLLAAIVTFSMIHAASVGSLRYRLPLEPVIAVLASGILLPSEKTRSPARFLSRGRD